MTDSQRRSGKWSTPPPKAARPAPCTRRYILRPRVKDVFPTWLGGVRTDLVSRYAEVCSKGSESSRRYQIWLSDRILPIIAEHGLPTSDEAVEDKFTLNGQTTLTSRNLTSRCCSEHTTQSPVGALPQVA
ncbi:hypothetical protein SK571_03810 [Lentzea sp. BCCO 10_0798]|uniref:Uncharacterized protein n=1 Tax=Lentzea kristufekii TaxID=3095430 RepID=A0ABU4TJS2_9PSEU|nr:hypothetical protein [Lentzea sp. BCCO 10_0798]MDX8048497.1 hypothetical protein [Lentzea sp. BCCO 10_0798]